MMTGGCIWLGGEERRSGGHGWCITVYERNRREGGREGGCIVLNGRGGREGEM